MKWPIAPRKTAHLSSYSHFVLGRRLLLGSSSPLSLLVLEDNAERQRQVSALFSFPLFVSCDAMTNIRRDWMLSSIVAAELRSFFLADDLKVR